MLLCFVFVKDIQTTAFYSSPKYNYTNGQNNITGYELAKQQENKRLSLRNKRLKKLPMRQGLS